MQPITESTPEKIDLIKLEENQINEKDNYQQQMKSNEQIFNDESLMSELNNVLKFSPFKIFAVFCLVIIIYVIACEMIQYSFIKLQNILKVEDAGYHRLFKCICCTIIIYLGVIAIYCLIIFVGGLFLYVTDNLIPLCVRYWYVEGKQSYKWWQTKSAITFIIKSVVIILWMMFVIELVELLLYDFSSNDMSNDRLIIYRISGLIIVTLFSIAFFVGVVFKKNPSHSIAKRVKAQ